MNVTTGSCEQRSKAFPEGGLAERATAAGAGPVGSEPRLGKRGRGRVCASAAIGLLFVAATAVEAQTPADPSADAKPAGDPAAAETASKLSFHAYINQAYARSDDYQIYGIPTDGTSNYSSLAFQLRYQMDPNDLVAVQLGHNRLGRSTINSASPDVDLDWAFYQRRLTDTTSVKVGRVQLPLGIYNEVQEVGTVLPFFSAPASVYVKTRTSQAFDGLMVSHAFSAKSAWSVDSDLYYGSWDRTEQRPSDGKVNIARAENAFGTQLWLNTPLSGVRFGLAALHFEITGSLNQVHAKDLSNSYVLSYDGTFDRFFTRAEYIYGRQPARLAARLATDKLEYVAYYGQVGYSITSKLKFNLQAERATYDLNIGTGQTLLNNDVAAGLNYFFDSSTVVKLELHRSNGTIPENEVVTKPVTTNFGLVSLAISF